MSRLSRDLVIFGAVEISDPRGGHDWGYWEQHLPDVLRFFGGQLTRG